jgi:hypothetical protein
MRVTPLDSQVVQSSAAGVLNSKVLQHKPSGINSLNSSHTFMVII